MTAEVTATPGPSPAAGQLAWHTLAVDQVLRSEGVDGQRGLSSAEAAARAQRFGPNSFAAGHGEPRWHAFVRQYRDPMQLVLLAAGIWPGSRPAWRRGRRRHSNCGICAISWRWPMRATSPVRPRRSTRNSR